MTYSVLELFRSLFHTASDVYMANGNQEIGVPMSSNYSRHLSGDVKLSLSCSQSRFAMAEITSGKVIFNSPLVQFSYKNKNYAALFLKEKLPDTFVQLKRIADYYLIGLKRTEFQELPFFNGSMDFSPVNADGKKFTYLEEALEFCYSKLMTVNMINDWERNLPLSDAPFCIQSYFLINNELPDYAEPYLDAKNLPLMSKSRTDWWQKNTAPYNCEGKPCNKELCAKRKYGKGCGEVSELLFEGLTQYVEEPVCYKWKINGKEIKFDTEAEIMYQDRFLRLCMRSLGILPKKLKHERWLRIINKALYNMRVIGAKDTAKLTIDRMNEIIVKELKDRILVSSFFEYERLMQGYIYLDPTTSCFVVDANAFCSYVVGRFRDIRIERLSDFHTVMRHLGFRGRKKSLDGIERVVLVCRSRFLFKDEEDWKDYMLNVSKGTIWEENFRAFLIGDDELQEDIQDVEKEEILHDAAVFLDTEANKGV